MEFSFIKFNSLFYSLITIFSIFVGFSVYLNNRKNRINLYFLFLTITMILYFTFSYLSHNSAQPEFALLWKRLIYAFVGLFVVFTYFFSVYFPKEGKRNPILDKVIVMTEIFFFFSVIFTDLLVKSIEYRSWGTEVIWGPGKNIWFGILILFTFLIVSQIIKKYLTLSVREKLQTQYFVVGVVVFVSINLIFNVIIPVLQNTYKYYMYGNSSAVFFLGFTAFAIIKRKLFDIKMVLTALLVGFIAILLSLDILIFTESQILQFFKGIALVIFLYLGRSLILSVLEEEKMLARLKKLNDDLANANDELKELIEMKTSFLHIVSHQLRTPLTAMRGYISMWQEGDFDDYTPRKMNEIKKRIANNTERLNNLVNEMVVAMESEGGIKLNFEKVNVEEIIKNNIEFMKANYEKKKLYIRYRKTEKNLPRIDGDAKYLGNAFMNLIDNAEKYTQKGGLKIKISREGDNIMLLFTDTGAGITPEDGKKLFHKFSRGASSSLINPNGSGLGLFIIKQIIRDHHGKIEFDSKGEGKGTVFTVTLPIRQLASPNQGGAASPGEDGSEAVKRETDIRN